MGCSFADNRNGFTSTRGLLEICKVNHSQPAIYEILLYSQVAVYHANVAHVVAVLRIRIEAR